MHKNHNSIALIGCGMVGMSFIYSSINKGLAQEFILIDRYGDISHGNSLDIEDAIASSSHSGTSVREGDYSDLANVDVLVITAGAAQADGETRMDLISQNSRIMQDIGRKVKASGFKGISLIVSNPVDVLAMVYLQTTGFDPSKVLSSGTVLDSTRLRIKLGNLLGVNSSSVQAYIIGEHGDSSVAAYSSASIGGLSLSDFVAQKKVPEERLLSAHREIVGKAYEIIKHKKASYYGIGNVISDIVKSILNDENRVMSVSVLLDESEYGVGNVFAGLPCVVGRNGVSFVIKPVLSDRERELFVKSLNSISHYTQHALEVLK